MTALGLVKDILHEIEPVVRTGQITEQGYALFTVTEERKVRHCCVSGMEYQLYGDDCYHMDNVQVAIGDSVREAVAIFQSSSEGEKTHGPSCSNGTL